MDTPCVLVCVTGQKTCERLILEGRKQADELGAPLSVVHVAKPGAGFLGNPAEGQAIEYLYKISTEHNADMALIHSNDVVATLAQHARRVNAIMVVLGVPGKGDWAIAHELRAHLPDAELHVVYTSGDR